jgi:peptidyl-prolyl cis-trans isomerase C
MKFHRMILVAAAAAALAACSQQGSKDKAASTSPPVATVNGENIDKDLYEFYARGVANKPASELTAEQREQVLDNLVRAKVIAEQAEKDGTAKETNTAALVELSRLNVLQQAVSEKYLKDRKASDQEMRAEYETQVAALPRLEYHARHILVATEQFAGKLVQELEKGAKFEDVARRESMDSKDNGGDLGWFTPDRMVKPFADAVAALKPGEFTRAPVQTQFGWHVIKLEDTRDVTPPPFENVKQRVEQMVQAKKFKSYVDELMKTAKVEKKLEGTAAAPAAAATPAANAPAAPAATEEKKP